MANRMRWRATTAGVSLAVAAAVALPAGATQAPKPVRCHVPGVWTTGPQAYGGAAAAEAAYLGQRTEQQLPGPGRWIHMPDYVYALPGAGKSLADAAGDSAQYLGSGAIDLAIVLVQAGLADPPACEPGVA